MNEVRHPYGLSKPPQEMSKEEFHQAMNEVHAKVQREHKGRKAPKKWFDQMRASHDSLHDYLTSQHSERLSAKQSEETEQDVKACAKFPKLVIDPLGKKLLDKVLSAQFQEIDFTPELDKRLKNVSSLPHGTGAKYLLTIKGQGDDLIAHSWHHVKPKLEPHHVLIRFGRRKSSQHDEITAEQAEEIVSENQWIKHND